jgi:hypothetical protein
MTTWSNLVSRVAATLFLATQVMPSAAATTEADTTAPAPEPITRGPLTGTWEGELKCAWSYGNAKVTLAVIHYGDLTMRAIATVKAINKDGSAFSLSHHAYGDVTRNWHSNSSNEDLAAGKVVWEPTYKFELDPSVWIEQPPTMRFGLNINAYERTPGAAEIGGEAGFLQGCKDDIVFKRISGDEPNLGPTPQELATHLDRLRYPAKSANRTWSVPAAQAVPDLQGGAFGTAPDNHARCKLLNEWTQKVWVEYPDTQPTPVGVDETKMARGTKLFTDETFRPLFGRSADELSPAAREFIAQQSLAFCGKATPNRGDWLAGFLNRGFYYDGSQEYQRAIAQAVAHRTGLTMLDQAIGRLNAIPNDAAGLDTLLAIAKDAETSLAALWPSEMRRFNTTLEETYVRLADLALAARLSNALTVASGLGGAKALQSFAADNVNLFDRVTAEVRQQTLAQVDAKIAALVEAEAAVRSVALDQRGQGRSAISVGNDWYAAFTNDFEPFKDSPPVTSRLDSFRQLRAADLVAAEAELVAYIGTLSKLEDVFAFRDSVLRVPGDWESEPGKKLLAAMRDRRAALYAQLESSGGYLVLSDYSPYEESLMAGGIAVRATYEQPKPHEILLALVRSVAGYSGERVSGNVVRYQLPSTRQILSSVPGISTEMLNLVQDISLPLHATMEFRHASIESCQPASSGGYTCRYVADIHVETDGFAGGSPSRPQEDHFVLTPSGWTSPTFENRLASSAIETWGVLSDGVVEGLKSVACIGAMPDDFECQN